MEEVEIKNIGGPRGAASEATLLRLLEVTQERNNNTTAANRTANRIQETYNKSVKNGDGIFKKLGVTVADVANEFIRGGDRVSDFSRHILGVNSNLQSMIEFADDAVDQFRSLSSVGAGFNNSIFDMMTTAATAGMRLDEFYNVVQNNSEVLRMLGGTVTSGAKEFSDLSKDLRGGDLGRRLFDLGFTISDVNSGMLTYIENQALQGRLENMSRRDLIRGSREYLVEIDALAKATGLSREVLMRQTTDLQNNAAFQSLQARAQAGAGDSLTRNMAVVSQFLPSFTDDLIQISRGTGGLTDLGIALNNIEGGQGFIDLMQRADELEPTEFLRQLSALGPGIAEQIRTQFSPEQMRLLSGTPLASLFDALTGFQRFGSIDVDQMMEEASQRDRITSVLAGFSDALARIKSEVLDTLLESEFADRVRDLGNSLGTFLTALFGGETPGSVIGGTAGAAVSAFQSLSDAIIGPEGLLTRLTSSFTAEIDSFTAAINSGTPPMDYFRERVGDLGNQLKNWFMDTFYGREVNEGPEFFREGGLIDTISNGFTNLFDFVSERFLQGQSLAERIGNSITEGITSFFSGPRGQQLISTISYYFEGLMLSLQEAIDERLGILSNRRLREERQAFELRGLQEGRLSGSERESVISRLQEQLSRDLASMSSNDGVSGIDIPQEQIDRTQNIINALRGAGVDITVPSDLPVRRVGTLQATGRNTEPVDTLAQIHAGERVLNAREAATVNDLPTAISQLNTIMAQIRDLTMQSLSHQEKTARGIKRLSGDIMGAA